MSRLDELIEKLCPDGVEYIELNNICKFQNGFAFKSSLFKEKGNPILRITNITDGKLTDNDYVFFKENDYKENLSQYQVKKGSIVVAMSGATTGKIGYNYSENIYYLNQRVGMFLPNENILNNRYLYHWLLGQSKNILNVSTGSGAQPNLSSIKMMKFKIPVPPLEVQCEIVHILDDFTLLSAELSAELKARQKQYEYYSKELFDFKDKVEYMALEDIAEIGTGSSNTNEASENGRYPFYVRSQQIYYKNDYEYDDNSIITSGDGVGVGKIFHFTNGKYALHQRAYRIHIISKKIMPKFYYYYMKSTFYEYIQKNAFNSSVTSVRRPMLNKYLVPIPPLEVQEKIVSILDRFDKLCNDISQGLPAEIEARQKQYKYYRDKLLTFKELKKEV